MPMVEQEFDREKHVYRDQDLAPLFVALKRIYCSVMNMRSQMVDI